VPATPTVALTSDSGISSTNHITSDPALTFSAPMAGDTLLYKVDGGAFSAAVPNFEADPNFGTDHLADGAHKVSVEQQDPLGNISAVASLTDAVASVAAATYGLKFLYLGLPESTPYPPVADTHLTDFHLVI
jgi:hypothetical protein